MVFPLAVPVHALFHELPDLLLPAMQVRGTGHVKHQIHVFSALSHPEIMEVQPGVFLTQKPAHLLFQPVQLRIVHHHRVIMDHQMDVVAAQALPLHVVDQFMAFQGVLPVVHLHMEAGKTLSGAIVMYHQVVVAQNLGLPGDVVHNFLLQLRVDILSQQRGDGVLRQLHPAVENEQRHPQTNVAVGRQIPEMLNQRRRQHRRGGNAVVSAVLGRGPQRRGVNPLSQTVVKQEHPQLHTNGRQQHTGHHNGKLHRGGVQNFVHGAFHQLRPNNQNQSRYRQAAEVFCPGVAERVVLIRRLIRQTESNQGYNGAGRIGQVVQCVGGNGHRAGENTHNALSQGQQQIAYDSHITG